MRFQGGGEKSVLSGLCMFDIPARMFLVADCNAVWIAGRVAEKTSYSRRCLFLSEKNQGFVFLYLSLCLEKFF